MNTAFQWAITQFILLDNNWEPMSDDVHFLGVFKLLPFTGQQKPYSKKWAAGSAENVYSFPIQAITS